MSTKIFTGIAVALFFWFAGACIYSFLNVVIYRVPRGIRFTAGRSYCPACGHMLSAADLIPVFSWLWLRGRCRYCGGRICVRDMWMELFGGCIALLCIYKMGFSWRALTVFSLFAILTAVAVVDMDTMEIPDGFHLAVLIVGAISVVTMPEIGVFARVAGMFSVSVPLFLITMAVPGAFGGGDIKLMGACGLFLGWKLNLTALFLAVLSGGGYGIYLLGSGKKGRKEHFAFGPFLCLGMAVSLLWGEELLCWYFGLWKF